MGSTTIRSRITISSLLNPCTSDPVIGETSALADTSAQSSTPAIATSDIGSEPLLSAEATHISEPQKTQCIVMHGKESATPEPLNSSILKGKAAVRVHSSEDEAMAVEALSSLAVPFQSQSTADNEEEPRAPSSSSDASSPPSHSLDTPGSSSNPVTKTPASTAADTTSGWRARAEFICTFCGPDADCDSQRRGEFLTKDCRRKCISSYFGRNQARTRLIPEDCFPIWCRPHYQRAAYQPWWPQQKCNLILDTFERIDAIFPGMRYTITLKRGELDRLGRACIAEKAADQTAESSGAARRRASTSKEPSTENSKGDYDYSAPQNKGKKREGSKNEKYYQAPLDILAYWHSHFCGEQKTKAQAIVAVNWIQSLRPGQAKIDAQTRVNLPAGGSAQSRGDPRITDVPAVLFLPEFPTETMRAPSSSPQKRKAGCSDASSTKKARGSS